MAKFIPNITIILSKTSNKSWSVYIKHTHRRLKLELQINESICEPAGFHSSAEEDRVLLGYGTMSLGDQHLTYQDSRVALHILQARHIISPFGFKEWH